MEVFPQKLGIVAGSGLLPRTLVEFCRHNGIETYVIGIDGHADITLSDRTMRIGAAGSMIAAFRERKINDLVIIGAVRRPRLSEMMPDLRTAAFLAKVSFRALGDDGLLTAVRAELEGEGFTIHGIDELLPDLLMPAGVLTRIAPDEAAYETIHTGMMASRDIGRRDIGQSVVVMGDEVLGTEDEEGTDELIKRAGAKGAILVKSSKPQQDRKLDMPTIGSDTVTLCASLGYTGIAAESSGVLMADRDVMIAEADRLGLFVIGV